MTPIDRTTRGALALLPLLLSAAAAACDDPARPAPGAGPLEPLIAFSFETQDARSRVGVIRPDGTGLRFVTDGSANAEMPAWSPDGMRLAMSYQGVAGRNPQLWTIGVDGGGLAQVPIGLRGARSPSWSPDGRTIVFDDFGGMLLVAPDGSALRPLLEEDSENGVAEWSPDGSRLLFTGFEYSETGQYGYRRLYVIQPDGTGLRHLASAIQSAIVFASWSPDGTQIVFDTDGGDLWVVTVATGALRRLTETVAFEEHPSWSPDGTRIVFIKRNGTGHQLVTMRADGTDLRQLTDGAGRYAFPSYRPVKR